MEEVSALFVWQCSTASVAIVQHSTEREGLLKDLSWRLNE